MALWRAIGTYLTSNWELLLWFQKNCTEYNKKKLFFNLQWPVSETGNFKFRKKTAATEQNISHGQSHFKKAISNWELSIGSFRNKSQEVSSVLYLQSRTEVRAQLASFSRVVAAFGGKASAWSGVWEGEGVMARIDLVPSSGKLCTEVSIAPCRLMRFLW